jgi:hypothetical protein
MKAYAMVLLAMIGFLVYLMQDRGIMEAKFIKPAGSTYFVRDGKITNSYNYTLLNKSNNDISLTIKVLQPVHGEISAGSAQTIVVKRDQISKGTVNISFPEKEIKMSKQNIEIGVYDQKGKELDVYKTYFEGPFKLAF